jgi:hypothetical protein
MDWQEQLISVYIMICKEYEKKLSGYITRTSNHSNLSFSDEEVMSIYMFGVLSGYSQVKTIYQYTKRHLHEWFPDLPSYEGFVQRLNKISHLFEGLVESLMLSLPTKWSQSLPILIDSFPIILAHRGRRFKACVAQEIATRNGYCATKKLHYYGVRLHALGQYKTGSLPLPIGLRLTDAGTADIKVLDDMEQDFPEGSRVFADKAYQRGNQPVATKGSMTLYTPVKKEKGQERLDAADGLLSTAISRVRQPIESFFNWIEDKTKIQIASKVRSYEGLMTHIFGKIAVALFILKNKFCS